MPRPPKKTLDFFLHDANARGDRKIKGLRRRHGNDGYAAYFILLEMLCQEDGMQLRLSDPLDTETAIEETGARDQAHLHAIIQTCADINLFDKQLWESERIVFSHGLYKRYKARLEERKADAQRKQRKREEAALQKRIEEIESQHETKIQNPESKTESDPYPKTKHPELSESCPPGQSDDGGGDVREDKGLKAQTHGADIRRFESRFNPEPDPPWVVEKQGYRRIYDPGFRKHLVSYLSGLTCNKDKTITVADSDIWLNSANFPERTEGQKRLADAYVRWDDYQARESTPPDQAVARNAELAKRAIAAQLAQYQAEKGLAS